MWVTVAKPWKKYNMKVKTILIAHNYTKSTFAAMSYYLAHHLVGQGWRVIFLSHKPFFDSVQILENGNLIVISWKSEKRPTGLADVLHFAKIYWKYKPQFIIGHFVGANISILLSKILSLGSCVTFYYYHTLSTQLTLDNGISRVKYLRKKFFYKYFVNKVLPNSHNASEDYRQFYGLSNFIEHITPLEDRLVIGEKFENKSARIKVGYLGRLNESKGISIFIKVFEFLKNENFEFVVAGSGPLESTLAEINHGNFNFIGPIKYEFVDSYIQQCDVILVPSFSDNLVTVGIESLMNETLLMISENTGLAHYLSNNIDSIIIKPVAEEIVFALRTLESRRGDIKKIAENGRRTYDKLFQLNKYFEFIDFTIDQNKK